MNLPQLHTKLFAWWRQHGRVLPWREKNGVAANAQIATVAGVRDAAFASYMDAQQRRDPYRVVVSEMMLQQTQVDRVLPKYQAWITKWPRIEHLAQATLADVLIFWQGLGYNRRARFLWLLAKEIVENRGGIWPETEDELRKLPGIGKYTARAIQTFAFGQHVGVVDTNVKRILQRVFAEELLTTELAFFSHADEILPSGQADPWNQALMDFGALICTAHNPKCGECPLQDLCEANVGATHIGFANYAAYLKQEAEKQKMTSKKKTSLRFEETDRYFRGRIMDELRTGSWQLDDLQVSMREKYGLIDEPRFVRLIKNLEKEGMLKKSGREVSLG